MYEWKWKLQNSRYHPHNRVISSCTLEASTLLFLASRRWKTKFTKSTSFLNLQWCRFQLANKTNWVNPHRMPHFAWWELHNESANSWLKMKNISSKSRAQTEKFLFSLFILLHFWLTFTIENINQRAVDISEGKNRHPVWVEHAVSSHEIKTNNNH